MTIDAFDELMKVIISPTPTSERNWQAQKKLKMLLLKPFKERTESILEDKEFWVSAIVSGAISEEQARSFMYFQCSEHKNRLVYFIASNGGKRYQMECTMCGARGSQIAARTLKNIDDIPIREHINFERWNETVFKEFYAAIAQVRRIDFNAYYQTPLWKAISAMAKKRDNYTCQICNKQAEVVHHLTYAHFQNEYLFELVSLCQKCHHDVYHSEKPQ